jgi:hypothetical protein
VLESHLDDLDQQIAKTASRPGYRLRGPGMQGHVVPTPGTAAEDLARRTGKSLAQGRRRSIYGMVRL